MSKRFPPAAGTPCAWWICSPGHRVPYIWLSGYQVSFPAESADRRLPGPAWVHYRRTLSLTVDWVDHSHSGWAAPVLVGSC